MSDNTRPDTADCGLRGWVYQDRFGQTRITSSWFAMLANGAPEEATESSDLGCFATQEEAFAAVEKALRARDTTPAESGLPIWAKCPACGLKMVLRKDGKCRNPTCPTSPGAARGDAP